MTHFNKELQSTIVKFHTNQTLKEFGINAKAAKKKFS